MSAQKTIADARPSPWVVKPAAHALGGTFGVQDANGVWVALAHPVPQMAYPGVTEKVADLIAAAPLLLAELESLVAVCEEIGRETGHHANTVGALAAIEAARRGA